jgi:CBASS immunity sensor of nucleotide second messenger signals
MAHIVAFSPKGPRGKERLPAKYLNSVANLMLLCHECHNLVDAQPERYAAKVLKKFKQRHEERVLWLTGSSPEHQTKVVILQSNIARQAVEIAPGEIQEAIAPRYPDAEPLVIDLTAIADGDDQVFWETSKRTIAEQIARLYATRLDGPTARHISLFALAPIPLLVFLGSQLSSKIPTDLYQRHRDKENWTWKTSGEPAAYTVNVLRRGSDRSKVSLLLSLSGPVKAESLPAEIDEHFSIYEITLADGAPHTGFLRLRQDLTAFQRIYQQLLALIIKDHGLVDKIHLFPAVPAPVAVLCGREPLPKAHPALMVYDFNKGKGGFRPTIRIN